MVPDGCPPTGLKYRSSTTRQRVSATHWSLKMCSMKSFVRPYGLVAVVGKSSLHGTDAGSPYTVAELLNTSVRHPFASSALMRLSVPVMLLL